nr:hypothetical protein HmN_000122900 [Hymenolepis microstoma]
MRDHMVTRKEFEGTQDLIFILGTQSSTHVGGLLERMTAQVHDVPIVFVPLIRPLSNPSNNGNGHFHSLTIACPETEQLAFCTCSGVHIFVARS